VISETQIVVEKELLYQAFYQLETYIGLLEHLQHNAQHPAVKKSYQNDIIKAQAALIAVGKPVHLRPLQVAL
jgi:hypothetical protein